MYLALIDESGTFTGMVLWTQSEGKINLITLSIIGLFHLFGLIDS